MSITNDTEADEAVQTAHKLFLDDIDGIDAREEYLVYVRKAQDLLRGALAYYRDQDNLTSAADVLEALGHIGMRFNLERSEWLDEQREAAALYEQLDATAKARKALTSLAEVDPDNTEGYAAKLAALATDTASGRDLAAQANALRTAGDASGAIAIFERLAVGASGRPALRHQLEIGEILMSDLEDFERAASVYRATGQRAAAAGHPELQAQALIGLCDALEDDEDQTDRDAVMAVLSTLKGEVSADTKAMIDAYEFY